MAEVVCNDNKTTQTEAGKLRVFISYSRDDIEFSDQLDAALTLCGFAPTIDRHGIDGGEAWQQRLGSLILEADTVVFVLSPSSATSPMCSWEVQEASRLTKRIIPVVARPLGAATPPQALADLNYVFFYAEPKCPGSGFGTGLAGLVEALNTDRTWIRQHTRLLERAREWDGGGRPASRLLSGSDIAEAKAWAAQRPKGAPAPTELHLEYIRVSEQEEARRASAERKSLEEMAAAQNERANALREAEDALRKESEAQRARARLRRIVTGGSLAAAAVLGVITYLAWERSNEADRQRIEAQANLREAQIRGSRALVEKAGHLAPGDYTTDTLLALEALPDLTMKDRPLVYQAVDRLTASLAKLRERFVFEGDGSLSRDGAYLLLKPSDRAPRLLEAATGKELFVLGRPDEPVRSAAFSPAGDRVLTQANDKAPRLWETATGKDLGALGPDQPTAAMSSFSPDGSLVLTQPDKQRPRFWQADTGRELFTLGDAEDESRGVIFSPDGKLILTLAWNHAPRLWSSATGQSLFTFESDASVDGARFSADGTRVLTTSRERPLHLWNTQTGERLPPLAAADESLRRADFSPNGKLLLTGVRGKPPRVWDTAEVKTATPIGNKSVSKAMFSPDSRLVLTISGADDEPPLLWDTATGDLRSALGDQFTTARTAVFSPDSSRVLTVSNDGAGMLWDTGTGAASHELAGTDTVDAVFTSDGNRLLTLSKPTSSSTVTMRVFDLSAPERGLTERFSFAADEHAPDSIIVSPDGSSALTVSDGTSHVWDLREGNDTRSDESDASLSARAKSMIERARASVPRCLTIDQRQQFFLRPKPPHWCIELAKHPYTTTPWQKEDVANDKLASRFGDFADHSFSEGEWPSGLEAVELSIRFAPERLWLQVNRAHALMFVGRTAEARALYLGNRGKRLIGADTSDMGLWDDAVLGDFKTYRDRGQDHPLMAEIEALLRPPGAAKQ